jgi:hypothetical protein
MKVGHTDLKLRLELNHSNAAMLTCALKTPILLTYTK